MSSKKSPKKGPLPSVTHHPSPNDENEIQTTQASNSQQKILISLIFSLLGSTSFMIYGTSRYLQQSILVQDTIAMILLLATLIEAFVLKKRLLWITWAFFLLTIFYFSKCLEFFFEEQLPLLIVAGLSSLISVVSATISYGLYLSLKPAPKNEQLLFPIESIHVSQNSKDSSIFNKDEAEISTPVEPLVERAPSISVKSTSSKTSERQRSPKKASPTRSVRSVKGDEM
jgi:hypothetical protein